MFDVENRKMPRAGFIVSLVLALILLMAASKPAEAKAKDTAHRPGPVIISNCGIRVRLIRFPAFGRFRFHFRYWPFWSRPVNQCNDERGVE